MIFLYTAGKILGLNYNARSWIEPRHCYFHFTQCSHDWSSAHDRAVIHDLRSLCSTIKCTQYAVSRLDTEPADEHSCPSQLVADGRSEGQFSCISSVCMIDDNDDHSQIPPKH